MSVGFGAYRISEKSQSHEKSLRLALDKGIRLIDTSSNYSNGDSERLIGKVLSDYNRDNLTIISKVGYIQGDNLEVVKGLQKLNKAKDDHVVISDDLEHSIHPDFIEDQIYRSLDRLNTDYLDSYLLHNPEYYLKTENSNKEEYYRRIKLAFDKMEDLVDKGIIKSYGISSNTFIDPIDEHTSTNLEIVMGAARSVSKNNNFKYIQFPMNIIEMGALERQYGGQSLIELAHSYNLKTISNRPLNCFSEQGLLRLANYKVDELYENELNADKLFNDCIQPLVIKWLEVREDEGDKLFDIPVMKQISSIWYKQNSKDAVDQVFMGYFFPLIARIWGNDLSPKESQPFYDLYDHAVQFSLNNINKRANMFHEQAIDKGLVNDSNKSLSQKVIEKYLGFGVDHVLVGMRAPEYVEDLSSFF